ncbi:hypothetical protein GXW82_09795 [Streptacidiphilus sp. 4-A2]|nr:hypothetical protein [Streptacidiphilus sp. 4-A2]
MTSAVTTRPSWISQQEPPRCEGTAQAAARGDRPAVRRATGRRSRSSRASTRSWPASWPRSRGAAADPGRAARGHRGPWPFLHRHLASVYAHWFGYRDGAFTRTTDDEAEKAQYAAKITLERELFDAGPRHRGSALTDQYTAADHLDELAATNPAWSTRSSSSSATRPRARRSSGSCSAS